MQLFIRTVRGWILRILGVWVYDHGIAHTHYTVEDFDAKMGELVRRQEFEHNCLLNEGITELLKLACSTGATKFDNGNAYTGVGDSDTAAVAAQTGLQGGNKAYMAMEATYPQVANQTVTFRSTFGVGDGNFVWKEATIANGNSDAAKNLNRKVQAMGEKTAAVTRIITIAITIG
jgi:hypothetical protein